MVVDEKGNRIHEFVRQGQIPKFKPLLVDGHVYYLQHFEVSPVIRPSRSTIHRFEVRVLHSFKELVDNVTDKTYLADIFTLITRVSPLASLDAKGKPIFKRNLGVTDGRCSFAIPLCWFYLICIWSSMSPEILFARASLI